MNTLKVDKNWAGAVGRARATSTMAMALVLAAPLIQVHGQGTLTFTFEGPAYLGGPAPQPPGTLATIAQYTESGISFWNPYGPENLALIGKGLSGYPDDGTAYLAITLGAKLTFGFSTVPNTYFNLVSFDAANYGNHAPSTLEVVGYKGMIGTVTNYFTTSFIFQTFYLDAQSRTFTGWMFSRINGRWTTS